MSSPDRTNAGDALVHHLPVGALSIDLALVTEHGRSAHADAGVLFLLTLVHTD